MSVKATSASGMDFRIGEKVPGTNWVVRSVLGRGGMGVVLDVEKEPSGLRMAMKVVRPAFAQSDEFIERFLEEVRVLARLRHPNIVEVTDCDRLADGSPYIMMERLQGRTLREALSDKDIVFAAENVWSIISQLCSALHCAHTAQPPIVHRDVKPGNVFLYDRKHFVASVKLIDFGISAVVDEKRAAGAPMGTARYMAPEACRGQPPTPQVDIYALGIVVYEMLTRASPWDLESRSAEAMIDAHLNHEPIPPSRRMGWIPKSVDDCLLRALHKDRDRRQRDVLEFREQLGELPFVDDGSGNHRKEGITAPTAETLAHGRGGPREPAAGDVVLGPQTSSPASIYVSAILEDTSREPSVSDSSSAGQPPASDGGRAVSEARSRRVQEEGVDTPLSSASEPPVRRRRPGARAALVVLGCLGIAASAIGYRVRSHATARTPEAASTVRSPMDLVDTPLVGRSLDRSFPAVSLPTENEPDRDGGVRIEIGVADRTVVETAKSSALAERSGAASSAPPKKAAIKREGVAIAPVELEPQAVAPRTKHALSDEELLFVPGAKK